MSRNPDGSKKYWIETETPDDWVSTPHEQVYFREGTPAGMSVSTTDLIKAGVLMVKALPGDWMTVITAGPYRGYDVKYVADFESRCIHLDFYSPRPRFQYLNEIIDEVKQKLNDSSDNQTEVGRR